METNISKRIQQIRLDKHLNMSELADMVNLKVGGKAQSGTVSNWEHGKNLPNKKRLQAISEIGQISYLDLVFGDLDTYIRKNIKEGGYDLSSDYVDIENLINVASLLVKEGGYSDPRESVEACHNLIDTAYNQIVSGTTHSNAGMKKYAINLINDSIGKLNRFSTVQTEDTKIIQGIKFSSSSDRTISDIDPVLVEQIRSIIFKAKDRLSEIDLNTYDK